MKHKLMEILKDVNGTTFVGLDSETDVKVLGGKSNPHVGNVTKVARGMTVMIATDKTTNSYENKVNKQLEDEGKEPNFEVGQPSYGTRIDGTPFVEHKGQVYLRVICLSPPTSIEYFYNGQPIDKSELRLSQSRGGAQGGVDNKVQIRQYKLASIKAIRVNHEEHTFK